MTSRDGARHEGNFSFRKIRFPSRIHGKGQFRSVVFEFSSAGIPAIQKSAPFSICGVRYAQQFRRLGFALGAVLGVLDFTEDQRAITSPPRSRSRFLWQQSILAENINRKFRCFDHGVRFEFVDFLFEGGDPSQEITRQCFKLHENTYRHGDDRNMYSPRLQSHFSFARPSSSWAGGRVGNPFPNIKSLTRAFSVGE